MLVVAKVNKVKPKLALWLWVSTGSFKNHKVNTRKGWDERKNLSPGALQML